MSDPRRLLDDPGVSSNAKELLSSLEGPAPLAPSARSAILSRVTNSLVAPATAKFVSMKAVWLLAGTVVAGAAGLASWQGRSPPEEKPVASAVLGRSPSVPRSERVPAPTPLETGSALLPEPSAKPAPARPAARRDPLALEEALLEQARRSIDSPAKALPLLREHERRFPNGVLTAERLYLTAQANVRAGDLPAARRAATLLAARFPKSTYVPRVRPLLERAPPL
jgi:hypothetical protein